MSRLHTHVYFDARYPVSAAGIVAAEHELVRLKALHSAYADQPNITPAGKATSIKNTNQSSTSNEFSPRSPLPHSSLATGFLPHPAKAGSPSS